MYKLPEGFNDGDKVEISGTPFAREKGKVIDLNKIEGIRINGKIIEIIDPNLKVNNRIINYSLVPVQLFKYTKTLFFWFAPQNVIKIPGK